MGGLDGGFIIFDEFFVSFLLVVVVKEGFRCSFGIWFWVFEFGVGIRVSSVCVSLVSLGLIGGVGR